MHTFIMIIVLLLASAPSLAAQELMPEPFTDRSIGIELMRPLFDGDDELDALSGAAHLSARYRIGGVHLLVDVPFARMNDDRFVESTAFGNVMLGLEVVRETRAYYATLRVPTAPRGEFAAQLAALADFQNAEAWFAELTTLSFGAIMRERYQSGFGFDALFGAQIMDVGSDVSDDDTQLRLEYGAQFVYRPSAIGMTLGAQGLATLSGDGNFAERTIHELRARLDYTAGRVRPAVGFVLPLDDTWREFLDGVVHLGVQLAI